MDARNLTAIPHSDAGSLEVIVPMGMRPYVGQATGIRALWPNGIIIHKSKFILSVREVDNSWRGMDSCHSCRGMWR